MSKKKAAIEAAESKTTAIKSAKKQSAKKETKETNSADVRKTVSTMVKSKALAMAEAVIGENEEGEVPKDLLLATVKYLFEVAAIYPPQADQDAATADEDCLAKTLLNRLNIPDVPIRRDEDEVGVSPEKRSSGESEGMGAVVNGNDKGNEPAEG